MNFSDRFCGARLNCIDDANENRAVFTNSFELYVHFNAAEIVDDNNNRGFNLQFLQLPCNHDPR